MASASTNTSSGIAGTSSAATAGFRLGENLQCDASESDSDQSTRSGDLLQSKGDTGAKIKSRSKKRRVRKEDRRQVCALTDELETLLGTAFQEPSSGTAVNVASDSTDHLAGPQTMEVDTTAVEKRLPKRTRQNLTRMLQRKHDRESRPHQQSAIAGPLSRSSNYRVQKPHSTNRQNTAQARRERKKKAQQAKKGAAQGDAMEIG